MKMKIQRRSEDREVNQARSKPDPVDRPVRTAHTVIHRYNGTQYCRLVTSPAKPSPSPLSSIPRASPSPA